MTQTLYLTSQTTEIIPYSDQSALFRIWPIKIHLSETGGQVRAKNKFFYKNQEAFSRHVHFFCEYVQFLKNTLEMDLRVIVHAQSSCGGADASKVYRRAQDLQAFE